MVDARPTSTNKRWTLGATLLLVAATIMSILPGVPKCWAPFPLPLFVLAGFTGPLVFVVPAGTFLLWSKQLLGGEPRVPYRTVGALVVLGCLSVWYFMSTWSDSVMRYGQGFVTTVVGVNVGFVAALVALVVWSYVRPSFRLSLSVHFVLFLWLAWYAFPYLGEGP
jgi:uncharacterized membrane protein YhdT